MYDVERRALLRNCSVLAKDSREQNLRHTSGGITIPSDIGVGWEIKDRVRATPYIMCMSEIRRLNKACRYSEVCKRRYTYCVVYPSVMTIIGA